MQNSGTEAHVAEIATSLHLVLSEPCPVLWLEASGMLHSCSSPLPAMIVFHNISFSSLHVRKTDGRSFVFCLIPEGLCIIFAQVNLWLVEAILKGDGKL
jgi:hypothetical protein